MTSAGSAPARELGKRAGSRVDLWYPAPDIDARLRYLDDYEPHGYGLKWTRRTR